MVTVIGPLLDRHPVGDGSVTCQAGCNNLKIAKLKDLAKP